ncbi:MAG: 1-acyl-sn-glycerol-3-phosphate acyltransferase [Rickettsiaceae bacterium]|nr:1-acyl-sn-glycerol-3-phosphate acyltransferase [Rickettsiaceae bacterium]
MWMLRIICSLDYKVEGLEKLPNKPAVFMANHQSFWDNMFMQLVVPKHSWIIKKELLDIPFFGWGLKILEPIAVNRDLKMSVRQIIVKGVETIANGMSMVIFPESTRLRVDENRSFKPSGVKLAFEASVPMVLIAHNSGLFWPKGFWISPGTIKVEIVDVIYPEQFQHNNVREMTDNVQKIIQERKKFLALNKN